MKKEEKIKEAWGEYWNRLNDIQKIWALENYGATSSVSSELYIKLKKSKLFELQPCYPKSLKGIKNNNGWLEIEDEDDLPYCDFEDLWVFINDKVKLYSEVVRLRNLESGYFETDITHYQPIEKPKPPIY